MLRRAFFIFSLVEWVTTADWGFIYTPSRSSSADAGKSARRPMGTAALARSLFVGCLRQWSQECQVFNISSIRQTQICLIDLFIFLYIMHNYNRYYCTCCIIPCVYCLLSVHHVHFYCFCVLMSFTIPVFPSLEAVKRLCASLRSAARSAVVRRTAARLALVQFLPCRMRLLQQISNSHLFRSGYAIY